MCTRSRCQLRRGARGKQAIRDTQQHAADTTREKNLTSRCLPSLHSRFGSTGHPLPFPILMFSLVKITGQRQQMSPRRFTAGCQHTNASTAVACCSSQLRGWPHGRRGPARSPLARHQPSWLFFQSCRGSRERLLWGGTRQGPPGNYAILAALVANEWLVEGRRSPPVAVPFLRLPLLPLQREGVRARRHLLTPRFPPPPPPPPAQTAGSGVAAGRAEESGRGGGF